ncbi:MAG: hypothetical protein VX438_12450 [Planctomycetota bacterium]|nr:hypothetical protein [Planctomycetota bacterium]
MKKTETLAGFVRQLDKLSEAEKTRLIQQNVEFEKGFATLIVEKAEPIGLRSAALGMEFIDGKKLTGKITETKVEVFVPKPVLHKIKHVDGLEPGQKLAVEMSGWVKSWDRSDSCYQILATNVKVPFTDSRIFAFLIFLLFSPLIAIFQLIRLNAILFWYYMAGLLIWRMVEWQQPLGCPIDMWLTLMFFAGGMFKFYWWAVTLADRNQTSIAGIEEPIEELEKLTNDQARKLSAFDGDLRLYSLESLTDRQAEILSRHQGGYLNLAALPSLTDAQAESLVLHSGALMLGSVKCLTDRQVQSLSRFKGELYMESIETLSDQQLEWLKAYRGDHLELPESFRSKLEAGYLKSSLTP